MSADQHPRGDGPPLGHKLGEFVQHWRSYFWYDKTSHD